MESPLLSMRQPSTFWIYEFNGLMHLTKPSQSSAIKEMKLKQGNITNKHTVFYFLRFCVVFFFYHPQKLSPQKFTPLVKLYKQISEVESCAVIHSINVPLVQRQNDEIRSKTFRNKRSLEERIAWNCFIEKNIYSSTQEQNVTVRAKPIHVSLCFISLRGFLFVNCMQFNEKVRNFSHLNQTRLS